MKKQQRAGCACFFRSVAARGEGPAPYYFDTLRCGVGCMARRGTVEKGDVKSCSGQATASCIVVPADIPSGVPELSGRLNIKSPPFEPPPPTDAGYANQHPSFTRDPPVVQCGRIGSNYWKARKIVKLLQVDQFLKTRRGAKLPKTVVCGGIRNAVRSMFAPELNPAQELSIKTSAKAEGDPCNVCIIPFKQKMLDTYKCQRLSPVGDLSEDHLDSFARTFSRNVPDGWNKRKTAYVPNGHATSGNGRGSGGNWVRDEFSRDCDARLVFSSGKPRVVTLYSSYNVGVLTPLHHSLYSFIKGRNWLLVGSPTDERLRYMSSGTLGPEWLSFDYESATDNIKTAYVQRAVEVLISKGVELSETEVECLRVLSNLSLDGAYAQSGQPMGSPMSFPLLCLINKTVVDLALAELLSKGEISISEYSSHRCLINGDDLLTKSTSGGSLYDAVRRHGSFVGLRVNESKTMRSTEWCEINSTAFRVAPDGSAREVRKTNVSALWMGAGVNDVLGFAAEACLTKRGFLTVVGSNVTRLARQKIKTIGWLPAPYFCAVLSSRKIRRAFTSTPGSSVPELTNLFPVEPCSSELDLTGEEIACALTTRVEEIRDKRLYEPLASEQRVRRKLLKKLPVVPGLNSSRRFVTKEFRKKRPVGEDRTLSVLASYWRNKRKEQLLAETEVLDPYPSDVLVFDGEFCSPWVQIRALLKTYKENSARSPPEAVVTSVSIDPDPFSDGSGWIVF